MNISFSQLLALAKRLSPSQKARLRKELGKDVIADDDRDSFMERLLNGPVYSEEDIRIIEENRKSMAAWRRTD